MSAATVLPYTSSPLYWRNESNPAIRDAILAYLCSDCELTAPELASIKLYLRNWINSPRRQGGEALRLLRLGVQRISNREDVRRWLHSALLIGIDPL